MPKQSRGLSFYLLTSAFAVILLQSACADTDVQPTLSLEEIGAQVAQTLEAEPVDTLSLEEIGTVVAQTLAADSIEADFATAAPSNTQTPTLTATVTPSITPSPSVTLPSISEAGCIPEGTTRELGRVISNEDGDTIQIDINGAEHSVLYIGIYAPDRGQRFFSEATNQNSSLVLGQIVTLVKDVSETDQFGRIVRYVLVGNMFVNYQLVRDGYAYASPNPPDVACSDIYIVAQRQAQSEGIGLWRATQTP
jgi:micrococcal nuclease